MIATILITIITIIGKLAVIWAPLLLGYLAFFFWHHFANERFLSGVEWTLLEVEIPREINKTPLAMELFYTNALYHLSGKGVWEEYWTGAIHLWFSLEVISIEGRIHFYIRTPSRIRHLVETQLYAQYPQVHITEVEDYTLRIPRFRNDGPHYLWGAEFKLANPDFFRIRTYIDFELKKPGEEEKFKVDPLTPMMEYLGAVGRGQEVWTQIIVRPSKKLFHFHGVHKALRFTEAVPEFTKQLLKPYTRQHLNPDGSLMATEIRDVPFLKQKLASIENKATKTPFDVGIRLMTLAEKDKNSLDEFNNLRRSSRLLWRQYAFPDSNEFARFNSTQFDYPFSDPTGLAIQKYKSRSLTFYKLRVMYFPPLMYSFKYPSFMDFFFPSGKPEYSVLNVEELATIYHFPGLVSEAPTLQRIESKTAKPPANLPT